MPSKHSKASAWLRDLAQEGVEPNPGPAPAASRPAHKQARKRRANQAQQLEVWQVNIRSWRKRGWDLLKAAEERSVQAILLQETLLDEPNAKLIARSSKKWNFLHVEAHSTKCARQRNSSQRPYGGVAIAVQKDLPAIHAEEHQSEFGEWLRVSLPGLHLVSTYRRQTAREQREQYNERLSESLARLGATTWLVGGDYKWHARACAPFLAGHLAHPRKRASAAVPG